MYGVVIQKCGTTLNTKTSSDLVHMTEDPTSLYEGSANFEQFQHVHFEIWLRHNLMLPSLQALLIKN